MIDILVYLAVLIIVVIVAYWLLGQQVAMPTPKFVRSLTIIFVVVVAIWDFPAVATDRCWAADAIEVSTITMGAADERRAGDRQTSRDVL